MSNTWATGLCGCCSYRDDAGSCYFCPTFFPQAVCGPCCIDGEIHTILNQQTPCCCRMSTGGWCTCLVQIPIAIFGPFGGLVLNICCGIRTRQEVIERYDIKDDTACCCCTSCVGCMFPCSLFQILMTLREFEKKGIKPKSSLTTPINTA